MGISAITITLFGGIFIDGNCVTGPFPLFLLPDPEVGPDVGNG